MMHPDWKLECLNLCTFRSYGWRYTLNNNVQQTKVTVALHLFPTRLCQIYLISIFLRLKCGYTPERSIRQSTCKSALFI